MHQPSSHFTTSTLLKAQMGSFSASTFRILKILASSTATTWTI